MYNVFEPRKGPNKWTSISQRQFAQNLLSLQSTAASMAKTQNRLATGLKVNSALDNPTNFFTASSLNSRAGDMANLLDSMSIGIKTIEAADNGLKSITKTVESMQSTLRQARQDKSFKTASYTSTSTTPARTGNISFSGGAVGIDRGRRRPDEDRQRSHRSSTAADGPPSRCRRHDGKHVHRLRRHHCDR